MRYKVEEGEQVLRVVSERGFEVWVRRGANDQYPGSTLFHVDGLRAADVRDPDHFLAQIKRTFEELGVPEVEPNMRHSRYPRTPRWDLNYHSGPIGECDPRKILRALAELIDSVELRKQPNDTGRKDR